MTSSKCGTLIGCSPAPLDSVRSSSQENVVKRNTGIYLERKNPKKSIKICIIFSSIYNAYFLNLARMILSRTVKLSFHIWLMSNLSKLLSAPLLRSITCSYRDFNWDFSSRLCGDPLVPRSGTHSQREHLRSIYRHLGSRMSPSRNAERWRLVSWRVR